jgi:anti-anti-sigma factor
MALKKEVLEFVNFHARYYYDRAQKIFIFLLSGSIDKEPILELKDRIHDLITSRNFNFIVDLSHVTYISSTGLGFLMYLMKYRNDFIFLSSPPEVIFKAFKLLDTDDLFMFYFTPEELKQRAQLSDEIVKLIKDESQAIKDITYKKRWVKILRENFPTYYEAMKEVEKLTPFIQQAEQLDAISIPSQGKYTCVLYKFLDRILFRVAKFNREEVDDVIVELVAKELMTNAIKHGYDNKPDGVVEAHYSLDKDKLVFHVIDYGKGFFPHKPSHDLIPPAGLELLRKIFDKVDINEAPKKAIQGKVLGKGTMVSLTKKLKT